MVWVYELCCVDKTWHTNYVQYLAVNISRAVQGSRLYNWLCWEPRVVQSVLTVSESSWKCEIWRTSQLISGRQTVNISHPWYLITGTGTGWRSLPSYQISLEILAGLETFIFIWLDFFVTNIYLEIDVYQRIKIFGIFYGDLIRSRIVARKKPF